MDAELLIPATAALLDGWVGPLVYVGDDGAERWSCVVESWSPDRSRVRVVGVILPGMAGVTAGCAISELRLDLSRAECRDRVARVIDGSGPLVTEIYTAYPGPISKISIGCTLYISQPYGRGWGEPRCIPALAALDPADDRRLPDGSRWVDAAALTIVAREVLRG